MRGPLNRGHLTNPHDACRSAQAQPPTALEAGPAPVSGRPGAPIRGQGRIDLVCVCASGTNTQDLLVF